MKTITVMGPLPKQVQIIKQQCKDVKLKFTKNSRSVPTADEVVLWTNFIDHSIFRLAEKVVGRERVRLYTGGLSGLIDAINGAAAA